MEKEGYKNLRGRALTYHQQEPDIHCDNVKKRFWEKVDKNGPNGCWVWTSTKSDGYGKFKFRSKEYKAYHMQYIWDGIFETIPKDKCIDHLCRNPSCVNPEHLEIVTYGENTRRGETGLYMRDRQKTVTHCKYGHPYDQWVTYKDQVDKDGNPRTFRRCSVCNKISCAKNYAKIKKRREGSR